MVDNPFEPGKDVANIEAEKDGKLQKRRWTWHEMAENKQKRACLELDVCGIPFRGLQVRLYTRLREEFRRDPWQKGRCLVLGA